MGATLAALSGINNVSGPGMLDFESCQSLEKLVCDNEACGMALRLVRGVGELRPDTQGFDLQDRATMEPLVDMGRDHGAIFLLHASEPVGHEYPGKGTVTPDILYPFICRYPGLKLVLAHWGGGLPFYALMPEVARALQNVYFDTSASSFLYRPQVFGQVTDIIGTRKVLFGSDFPLVPQARPIGEIEALDLSPEAKRLVLGENARSLLAL